MSTHIDHSVWAVRPEVMAAVQRLVTGDVPHADLRRLLDEPVAPEARVRTAQVDAEDLTRVGSVAIIGLQGLIQPNPSLLSMLLFGGGGGLQQFRAELRAALEDDTVSAIAIQVDSPGGRSALVEETAAELRAARDRKPILAIANTTAASAAYWIASQANELVVTPSGYVGSVGVYMLHTDLSGALEQEGVAMTYVYAGRFKTEGNPYEPLTDDARGDWQRDVDGIHDNFVRDVALGRGVAEDTVRSQFGEGRLVRAPDALAGGMVNRVATFEEAIDDLRSRVEAQAPPPSPSAAAPRAEAPAKDPESNADAPAADEPATDAPATDEPAGDEPPPSDPPGATAADDFDVLVA